MEGTTEKLAFERQEHLGQLPAFSARLGEAIRAAAAPDQTRAAVLQALRGQCVGCAIPLSGEEILAIAEPGPGNAKVERLRKGDCARQTCTSAFYLIRGAEHPGLDWPKLLGAAEDAAQASVQAEQQRAQAKAKQARLGNLRRVGVGLAILVVLLLGRQCYLGGSIPLLRQPEKFEVDRYR